MKRIAFALWLAVVVLWMVFPFHYAVVTSLQTGTALFEPALLPKAATLGNYRALFLREYFPANIANSALLAITVVGISLAAGVFAAWALGRVEFRGRRALLLAILAVSMFPQVAVLSGLYQMFIAAREFLQDQFGIAWTRPWSLTWLAFSYTLFTLPFTVWTLTAYLRAVPQELEDAARIDGAGYATIVRRIYLPLLRPALVTTGLMAFVATWNEFLFALSFTSREPERTATVAIAMIAGVADFQVPWGTIMAAAVIVTLPVLGLVFVFQRRLVAGLMAGAVKG
ncbi:carbohydrate ABC transporter permease [Xylophilus sp.]|uniref:carbohydrate ABC transporter permease n=1 Tax=Xylophilus sp. TaxID=2653893 RepID=UPI0013B6BE22|nr:carbohydrate ABC transporter permease [Xylophilus sp.]KAF1048215.1 MAG: Trehalose transport system permease protein SugB [Xylophilus sp.]